MLRRLSYVAWLVLVVLLVTSTASLAKDLKAINLPQPNMKGGMPLMEALKARRSIRTYTDQKLSNQILSDILWAAFGLNRPDDGKRTAPSARNWQETDIYVALEEGIYIYNAANNVLEPIVAGDHRALTGVQIFVRDAPCNLVYVADYSKMAEIEEALKDYYSAADCGFISQNVYLYCASAGLGTVVRAVIEREELAKILKLREDQRIVLAQSIGYPREIKKTEPSKLR
jgi:SagB-type dehydrogenase family enzyme